MAFLYVLYRDNSWRILANYRLSQVLKTSHNNERKYCEVTLDFKLIISDARNWNKKRSQNFWINVENVKCKWTGKLSSCKLINQLTSLLSQELFLIPLIKAWWHSFKTPLSSRKWLAWHDPPTESMTTLSLSRRISQSSNHHHHNKPTMDTMSLTNGL